jgi:RsiW-degrading membrane proteinase PrsW (M82 family)
MEKAMSLSTLDSWGILAIVLGLVLFALPVIIYYLRVPYKPEPGSVLILLLALAGIELIVFTFLNALVSLEAGAWVAGIIWAGACICGWVTPSLARAKAGRGYLD